uniref:Uncharacterized protein n=1 Tax=Nelumbo nucifera TaxID=4432 RepID=A0A822Y0L9_NELNU|nr:TPA_asm: hypothetical protein HUJ06_026515 [Nelumbo nucifera]
MEVSTTKTEFSNLSCIEINAAERKKKVYQEIGHLLRMHNHTDSQILGHQLSSLQQKDRYVTYVRFMKQKQPTYRH